MLLAGDLDVPFGTAGKVLTDFGTDSDEGAAIVVDASNRILVAGTVLTGTGDTDFALARYTSAGVLDTNFGVGGKVTTSFNTFFQRVYDIAVQADGKIVVAGSTYGGANYDFGLARYNSNGTLDNTFDDNGLQTVNIGGDDVAHAIAIQADGKIVIVGETEVSGQKEIAIARLNPADGQRDTSFGSLGQVVTALSAGNDFANDVALQSDGKIVIAGTTWNGTNQVPLFARYTTTGTLDTTFDENGTQALGALSGDAVLNSLLIQPDGKIVGAGTATGTSDDFLLTRVLGTNGAFDTAFNSSGYVVTSLGSGNDRGSSILRSSDGSIIVTGTSATAGNDDFAWARFSASGLLDSSFAKTGFYRQTIGTGNDVAQGAVMLASGQYLVAGYATDGLGRSDFALVRVNTANTSPTAISLSPASVAENLPSGATVGSLATTDFDSTSFTYSLVSGSGSTDNSSFALTGATIKTAASFDYESKSSYSIRVRSTDSAGAFTEQALEILIVDVNDPLPTIVTSTFEDSGTVLAGATSLAVTFNKPVSFSLGSQERPAASAQQIKTVNPTAADGIYWIDPDGAGAIAPFQVYCDMTTDGGGWMLAVNSVLGAEPGSNDLTSNTGTVGLTSAHTRNLNSYFAGTATAEVRHDIDGSNVGLGRFHGKYTADSYQATFSSVTTLSGHSNSALLQGSFNAPFGSNPGGAPWFYNGNPQTTIPASPSSGSPGPLYVQTGQILNSYRIWIRGGATVGGSAIGGAELASNYELRRAGADGLLGNGDDPFVAVTSVTMSGNTATLNFAALSEDVYRLTVKDTITDASGNALDGDANGSAGTNWRKDFVVGALSTSLTSPNGFVFDPEFGGFGAGQLVQGTGNAFDGLGRLSITGTSYLPNPTTVAPTILEVNGTSQRSTTLGDAASLLTTTPKLMPGLTQSITLTEAKQVRLSAVAPLVNLYASDLPVELAFRVDGNIVEYRSYLLRSRTSSLAQVNSVSLEDYITLSAGSHTIDVVGRNPFGGSADVRYSGAFDGNDWSVSVAPPAAVLRVVEHSPIPHPAIVDGGRTVSLPEQLILGTAVRRQVTFPSTGSDDFARTVDTFTDSTGSSITTPVRVVGNLGSDAVTTVFATSDGDLLVEPTDLWFGTDDADGTGTPAIIHLLHGPYGLQPSSVNVVEDNVEWTYDLTVPAGATKRLANFTVLGTTRAEAIAAANALVTTNGFGGEAAAFLTTDELASLANFQFNTAPTKISISTANITTVPVPENAGENFVIGSIFGSDPEDDPLTFSLPVGVGDNHLFNIDGVSLRANDSFDFEMRDSYSITIRATDSGGLYFERSFTVSVTNVVEDTTAPVSLISSLPSSSSSLSIPVSVTGNDPGTESSGIQEYDLYYSTGGAFIKFATLPASSASTTFTGSANTTYWFRSLARDLAGNVEAKTTADTYTRIGDVVAPATQVTSAVPNSAGLFTVQLTGTKVSGTALTVFDVYVSIDGNTPVLIGAANGVSLGSGNYSGQILFQGVLDGTSHSYRFYSRGRDGAGNVEAAPVTGDVSVTYSFASAGLTATAIDVQNGIRQRSYVRYLDVLFSSATGVDALLNAGRVKVERFAIDAASVTPETGVNVPGAVLAQTGNRLRLDFGVNGLGGLRQAGNGFYRVLLDLDGNGSFADAGDNAFEFHRLFGDANGDAKVDVADTDLVTSQVGRTGTNLDGDLDGNGAVNSTDRLYTVQQRGKKLLDPLLGWLDD